MSSEEKKIEEMKTKLEAGNKFKVLTQHEYEALLLLSNPTAALGTATAVSTVHTTTVTTVHKPVITAVSSTAVSTTGVSTTSVAGAIPKVSFTLAPGSTVSTPSGGGAIPKFVFPGYSPVHPMTPSLSGSFVAPTYSHPKLPVFSGQENKGDVTYEVWSYEVKCLQNSLTVPNHILLQAIRTSLRGDARSMITSLGENATVADILNKLDGYYGLVSTCETLMQNFFSDFQKESETVVQYGSRLEQTLSRALRDSNMEQPARDAMLRSKFWTGLSNRQLKNSTRHLFDSVKDFQLLLREIRKVEQEEATDIHPAGKQKIAQQHYGQTSDLPDTAQLSKQLSEMMEKMKAMEKKIDSQQQVLSSKQFSFSDDNYQQRYGRSQFNRGRSNSYSRGSGQNNYRASSGGRNRGRGFQNFGNNDDQSNVGGGSRGGNRSGPNGRWTNRGGNSRGNHLNS